MKLKGKSSITLPPAELKLVHSLKAKLKAKSNVEVIRRSLKLLNESHSRETLRQAYKAASDQVRNSTQLELEELDHLTGEGLD